MVPFIIAFSGRIKSGKDTMAKFIHHNRKLFFNSAPVEYLYFAKPMKDMAVNLGVPHELVWGTDEQKNTLIHIRWEDLPHYLRIVESHSFMGTPPPTGRMTVRQLLQQIGENIFNSMYDKFFINQYSSSVEAMGRVSRYILTPDLRKPEQVDCVHNLGGIVVRLLRDPYAGTKRHISETALDDYPNFDIIIDNRNLSVKETCLALAAKIHNINLLNRMYHRLNFFIERLENETDWSIFEC